METLVEISKFCACFRKKVQTLQVHEIQGCLKGHSEERLSMRRWFGSHDPQDLNLKDFYSGSGKGNQVL